MVGEKSYLEMDNQISELSILKTEEKTWWSLRNASETWDLKYWGTRELRRILAKIKICQIWRNTAATGLCILDLEQHRCSNRTVYGLFRSEDSRCGATPLLRDCVRVNSFQSGSQHIPDLEQHPYHMLVNTFVRFDNPELKQHRCYGTVYGSIRFIMYYYDFCFFSALPSSSNTWHRLHL